MSANRDALRPAPAHDKPEQSKGARRVLVVNGGDVESAAASLADLLMELGYAGLRVATAVNGEFVSERQRQSTPLSAGDRIEVVAARQGG